MRFLVITNYYPPYFQGGYEICCEEMCRYLVKQGHEVFILTGTFGISFPDHKYYGIQQDEPLRILQYIDYTHGDYFQKTRVENANYRVTIKAIRDVRPDMVYFWSLKALSLGPVYAARKMKCKSFFDIGDIWMDVYFQPGFNAKMKRKLKSLLPFTIGGKLEFSPVMISTKWMVKEMKSRYNVERMYVVPRGLDLPEPSEKVRNSMVRYMFTGRIEPLKGLDLCLRAFSLLRLKNPDFQFTFDIYGSEEEPYGKFCHTLAERFGFEKEVTFHGMVKPIQPEYSKYDVLLMPTMAKEAFGRVILEAMIEGLVVIASNHYGPAEIIHHRVDGILFEPGDIDAFAEAIDEVHHKENLRAELGKKAVELVKTKYDNRIVLKHVEQILLKEVGNEV